MIVVVWLCLSFTCFPNSEGYIRHLFHRCQASGLISQKQELPEKGGLNISSTLNCAGFNATYTHHLSVATRPSSRSGVNKCDWNSAMCCPFLSLCREQKHKAGTWGAHLCRTRAMQHHGTELSWANSKGVYTASSTVEPLQPWHLKLTWNLLHAPQSSSSKQKEKQEGNNSRNAEK